MKVLFQVVNEFDQQFVGNQNNRLQKTTNNLI